VHWTIVNHASRTQQAGYVPSDATQLERVTPLNEQQDNKD
jgi:hypothetical protein